MTKTIKTVDDDYKFSLKNNGAQSLVEMALILPLFIMLIIGIFDFGRAFHIWTTLNLQCVEAARVGAQRRHQLIARNIYTSNSHASLADVQKAFDKHKSPLMSLENYSSVEFNGVGVVGASEIEVSASYSINLTFPFLGFFGKRDSDGSLLISARAVERKE